MREILFRGKRKDDGEWVEGYLMHPTLVFKDNTIKSWEFCTTMGILCTVGCETIGQYTGLTDKNGTKIFEGDILKIIDGKEIIIASVKFGDYNQPDKILKTHIGFYFDIANLVSYRKDIGYWFGKTFSEIEVIGNVHDNPELLQD